ncbi:MAG: ferritin-like domain-containing protein [Alphaproteobacteria bacterium]|nr:ferritin-like domain-containing protein [Alphaproteobacteria bacterium]
MIDRVTPVAENSSTLVVPRRTLLGGAGGLTLSAAAVMLLAGCARGADQAQDVEILNTALALEYEAIAAYQLGAESGLLQKPVLDVAVAFQGDHSSHAELLSSTVRKMGGRPVEPKPISAYPFRTDRLKTQADVLRFAAELEKGAASAYLGAVPVFTNKDLSKAAASILGAETMHWAILRNALGEPPVPAPFVA